MEAFPQPWKALCAVLGNLLDPAAGGGRGVSCRLWSRNGISDCGSKGPKAQVGTVGIGLQMVGGKEMIDLGEIRRWK